MFSFGTCTSSADRQIITTTTQRENGMIKDYYILSRLHRRPIHLYLWSLRRDGKKVKTGSNAQMVLIFGMNAVHVQSHKKIQNLNELIIGKLYQM